MIEQIDNAGTVHCISIVEKATIIRVSRKMRVGQLKQYAKTQRRLTAEYERRAQKEAGRIHLCNEMLASGERILKHKQAHPNYVEFKALEKVTRICANVIGICNGYDLPISKIAVPPLIHKWIPYQRLN